MKKYDFVIYPLLLVFLLTLNSESLLASEHDNTNGYNKFSLGLSGGLVTSFTDIKDQSVLPVADEMSYGGSLFLNYHQSPVLTFRGNFMYGSMKGVDPDRNIKFNADLMQADVTVNLSINGFLAPASRSNNWMNFYGYAGVGVLFHDSRQQNLQTGDVIRYPYAKTEADAPFNAFIVPFGLGVNFKMSERIALGIQSGFVYAFSDELDAYVVPDSRKDMYNYTSVGLTLSLGRKERSKDWAPIQSTVYPGDIHRMDAMAASISEIDEKVEAAEVAHASGMEQIHGEIEGLASKQQELSRTNIELEGTLDDFRQRLVQQEERMEEVIEKARVERYLSVQVLASSEELSVEEAKSQLGIDFDLDVIYVDGWYKFFSGKHQDLEDAKLHMQRIWGQGVRDAFIVVYENGNLTPR